MKKIYTLLIISLLGFNSFAIEKPFGKYKEYQLQKSKLLLKQKTINNLTSLGNIPGLTKTSNWDELTNAWFASNAQRQVVSNNQIVNTYFLSYNLADTFNKISYTYDNQGRYLSSLYEVRDFMGNYYPQSRANYTYSTNGLAQTTIIESYDTVSKTWRLDSKILNEKNDRGESIKDIYYYYNNNAWEVSFGSSSKITYLNSTSVKTTEIIDSTFDFNTKLMVARFKITQAYDANGRAVDVRFFEEDFSTGSLMLINQDSVYYDANGLPNLLVRKEVDASGNASDILKFTDITWLSFNQDLNLFDNNPVGYNIYFKLSNIWFLTGRASTSFPDNNGSEIYLEEVYEAGTFIPSNKSTLLYNSNKDLIQDTEESYDNIAGIWNVVFGNKYLITYDANNNQSEYISQNYNTDTKVFVNFEKREYSDYVQVNTGVSSEKRDDLIVYPNPVTSNELNIKHNTLTNQIAKVSIFDISGKQLKEIDLLLNGNKSVLQLDNLEKGVYLIKFESNNETTYSKFIKE